MSDVAPDDLRICKVETPVGIVLAEGIAKGRPTDSDRLGASNPKPWESKISDWCRDVHIDRTCMKERECRHVYRTLYVLRAQFVTSSVSEQICMRMEYGFRQP